MVIIVTVLVIAAFRVVASSSASTVTSRFLFFIRLGFSFLAIIFALLSLHGFLFSYSSGAAHDKVASAVQEIYAQVTSTLLLYSSLYRTQCQPV
jgi:hypothetical protein